MAHTFRWVISSLHQVAWPRILQSVFPQQNTYIRQSSSWFIYSSFERSIKKCVMFPNLVQRHQKLFRSNLEDNHIPAVKFKSSASKSGSRAMKSKSSKSKSESESIHLRTVKLFGIDDLFMGKMSEIEAEQIAFKMGYKLIEFPKKQVKVEDIIIPAFRMITKEEYEDLKERKGSRGKKRPKEIELFYRVEANDLERKIEAICSFLDEGKDVYIKVVPSKRPSDGKTTKFKALVSRVTKEVNKHGILASAKAELEAADIAEKTLTLVYKPKDSELPKEDMDN